MKIPIILFWLSIMSLPVKAQQNYDVSLIPKELLPYASAVVRDDQLSVDVEDFNSVMVHAKMAVTILNKNGDRMSHVYLFHDKSRVIKNVKGVIYNELGKQIGKFSEGDFEDNSAWDGFSLFLDTKVKYYIPAVTSYPYTIAYEYDLRLKQSLELPDWAPNPHYEVAVEKSSFIFSCKPDFKIRYKENNLSTKVNISTNTKGLKTYAWQANHLKPVKYEPLSPYDKIYLSSVKIAPEKFTYGDIPGTFTNWNELGKWYFDKLVADRQQLPQETVDRMKEITKNIASPKLKAKRIYEYMQDKTHYISVQVGIGGYQPFLAGDVDKQNYGDCKALVNYTQALLKAVNVDSYYCVVEAGREYKVSLNDFATMQQGDHIILCLPFKNDTTWAECTSQTIPFGFLGDFTDDRTVLACTAEGGKLMHTPKYTADNNLESRKASFIINESGELSGEMTTKFGGTDYEERSYMVGETKDEQFKRLKKIYPINNFDIDKLEFERVKSSDPWVKENIKLHARDYASQSDGKIFFMLNSFDRSDGPPAQVHNRLNDVYINRGYTEEDEITYTLPVGYHLEKTPLNYSVAKPFGSFAVSMTINGDKMVYKRKFQLIDGTYNKDVYGDLVDFYQVAYDADQYTVSLVKK